MSFLTPKYLRYRSLPHQPALEIDFDRPCAGCGYNLRGLKLDGRCPECGLNIQPSEASKATFDLIGADDPVMRRRMQRGFLLAAVSLAGMVAMRLWMIVPFPRPYFYVIDIAALLFAMAWCAGVWQITPKQLDFYGATMKSARQTARILALAWPVAALGILLCDVGVANPRIVGPAYQAWAIGRVLGGIGVLVVLYLFALPAYDADRDDISRWLITAFWGLLFLSPFIGMVPRGIAPVDAGWVFYGFLAVFIAVWLIFAAIAVLCLYALHRTAAWKTGHLSRHGARSERIRETRAEIDRDVEARIRPLGDSVEGPRRRDSAR